jgi:AraC family ethanolamine operon transcriptional activator
MNALTTPQSTRQQRTYARGSVDTDIPGWKLHCLQTTSGSLNGGSRELHAAGVQVLEEHYRHLVTNHYGVAPPDAIGFAIPGYLQSEGVFDGRPWKPGSVCMWNTNREFNAMTPPSDLICVIVDRGLLAEHIGHTEHIDLGPALLRANLVTPPAASTARLARRMGQLIEAGFSDEWDTSTPAAQQAIRQEVLETLAPFVVEQLEGEHDHRGRFNHLVNVRRAREVALSQPDTPLQVQDLCQALQVSRRTLQESFRVVLGISPLSYLRALRLDGARRELMAGRPVKQVIETWGFWHWSRFSQDYRRLFGESPSATMRRAGYGSELAGFG